MTMFNIKTLLSTFDKKGTLMKWLKELTEMLQKSALTGVSVEQTSQTKAVLKFNFEDGSVITSDALDLPRGLPGLTGAPAQKGLNIGFEARQSLTSVPALSFGAQASFSPAWCSSSDFEAAKKSKYHKYYITPEFIIDYNILPGRKISPFVSIGAGVQGNIVVDDGEPARRDFGGIVNPRLGIEFFHRIRIYGELKKRFDKSSIDDYFAVNVSWIFVSKKN